MKTYKIYLTGVEVGYVEGKNKKEALKNALYEWSKIVTLEPETLTVKRVNKNKKEKAKSLIQFH